MLSDSTRKQVFTIPNLLSLFRLLLIPVYICIYLNAQNKYHYILAGLVLTISCLTDILDGKIARKYHCVSRIGIVLDPFADKCTQLAISICLSVTYPALYPFLFLFIIKESLQLIAGLIAYMEGRMLPGALLIGKICTTVLSASFIALVVFQDIPPTIVSIITIIDGVFLILSSIGYFLAYFGKNRITQDISK